MEVRNQYKQLKPGIMIRENNEKCDDCVIIRLTSPRLILVPGIFTTNQWWTSLRVGSALDGASGSETEIWAAYVNKQKTARCDMFQQPVRHRV